MFVYCVVAVVSYFVYSRDANSTYYIEIMYQTDRIAVIWIQKKEKKKLNEKERTLYSITLSSASKVCAI